MQRHRTARNVAIIAVVAAAVYWVPQGGRVAGTIGAILSVAFAAGVAFVAGRYYQERRVDLYSLGDRGRGLLYGAVAVGVVTITAQPRMWQSGAGALAWFLILGGVVWALISVFLSARRL